MKFKEILSTKTKNEVYLNRYLSFVDNCQRRNDATDLGNIYCEKHHILPKSDFPEYRSDPDNIVLLTGRQHFLSHWMLAKALSTSNMWFAFNQMRRICKTSVLYEYSRIHIARAISEANTGKKRTQEFKDQVSLRFKGKTPVRDTSGRYFMVDRDDIRWKSGEIMPARLGKHHSDITKKQIGDANAGKKYYINDITNIVRMFLPDQVPIGYSSYVSEQWFLPTCKDTTWYHNPKSGEHQRLAIGIPAVVGFIPGRAPGSTVGWAEVNSNITVIDVQSKIYVNIKPEEFNINQHYDINGVSLKSMKVMLHGNNVIMGYNNMLIYCKKNNIILDRSELVSEHVKRPHHRNSEKTLEFRNKYNGKHISHFNIKILDFNDFIMQNQFTLIKENH